MITPEILPFEIRDRFKKYQIGIEVDSAILTQRIYVDFDYNSVQSNTEVLPFGNDFESPYFTRPSDSFAVCSSLVIDQVVVKICSLTDGIGSFIFTADTPAGRKVLAQLKLTYG